MCCRKLLGGDNGGDRARAMGTAGVDEGLGLCSSQGEDAWVREEASAPQTPENRPKARWVPALLRAEKSQRKRVSGDFVRAEKAQI